MAKNDKIMPQEELSFLCGQLAMMRRAGIPLADGVGMLRENFQDAPGGRVLESMEEVLGRGGTFREAAERAGVFPAYMTGMVEVGERAGRLEQVLEGLAAHYRREARVRESIRAAVAYPLVLAGIMAVVMGILLVGVLPVFSRAFASLGVQVSQGGMAAGWVVLAGTGVVLAAAAVFLLLLRTGARSRALALFYRLFPSARRAAGCLSASRFASVISLMLLSGCDARQAVELASGLMEDPDAREKARACLARMDAGDSFAEAVASSGMFQEMHSRMIAVGARSGALDSVMGGMAEIYQEQADDGLDRTVSRVEPVLVGLMCLLTGGVLLSVMLPLLDILSSIL